MRSRRPQSCGDNVDASATVAASLPGLSAPRGGPTCQADAEQDSAATDTYDAYATLLQNEADDNLRRQSFWRPRCSAGILVGLLIWTVIGLVVYVKIDHKPQHHGASEVSSVAETAVALLPDGCLGHHCLQDGGSEPFGTVLGANNGVIGYSNCYSSTCVSRQEYQITLPTVPNAPPMRTGMKWQCVEYARRYWMLRGTPYPAAFGSVNGASNIWADVTHVTLLGSNKTTPLLKFANGVELRHGGSAPRTGDLLIYPRDTEGVFPYGHVAVVVGVETAVSGEAHDAYADRTLPSDPSSPRARQGLVYLAEQNWQSVKWEGPHRNYSRTLTLQVQLSATGQPLRFTVEDPTHPVQGWVRYADSP